MGMRFRLKKLQVFKKSRFIVLAVMVMLSTLVVPVGVMGEVADNNTPVSVSNEEGKENQGQMKELANGGAQDVTPIKVSDIILHPFDGFGKFMIQTTSRLSPYDIKNELIITSAEKNQVVDYNIYRNDYRNGQIYIEIINPNLGILYKLNFSDKITIKANLDTTIKWELNESNMYIEQKIFPEKPIKGSDFNVAIRTPFNFEGINISNFKLNAYKTGTNQKANGNIILRKIKTSGSKESFSIFTLTSDTVENIDIEFILNNTPLGKLKNINIYNEDDDKNNDPSWWVMDGMYSLTYHQDDKTSIVINWNEAFDLKEITHYKIIVNEIDIATLPSSVLSYKLTGLSLDTEYRIEIAAENVLGRWTKYAKAILYKTPDEDKVVTGVDAFGGIVGGFRLHLVGASAQEIRKGLKVFFINNGTKQYVDFSIDEISRMITLNFAVLKREYFYEISQPLVLKEGTNTKLVWNSTLNRSKTTQTISPSKPKINEEFTFKVRLNDAAGFGYRNFHKDNFSIVPLVSGTDKIASGNLIINNVKLGDNLEDDGKNGTDDLSTYYITASYSKAENIDIQVNVDNVVLPEKLKNVSIVSDGQTPEIPPTTPPTSQPNGGSSSGGSSSPVVAPSLPEIRITSDGVQLKGDLKNVNWNNLFTSLKETNKNQITVDFKSSLNVPLAAILLGKQKLSEGYILLSNEKGTAKLKFSDINEDLLKNNFDNYTNLILNIVLQPEISTSPEVVAHSLPVRMYVKNGEKQIEVNWLTSQVILPKGSTSDVIVVKKNADTGEWAYEPATTMMKDGQLIVEFKHHSNDMLYVLNYSKTFDDVKGHWAEKDVSWLASRFIVKGNYEGLYKPQDPISRAEVTSLLMRILGSESGLPQAESIFKDVDSQKWYSKDINQAFKLGLINGLNADQFAPNDSITREQLAVMLSKVIEKHSSGKNKFDIDLLISFSDKDQLSDWAISAMKLLVNEKIMQGNEDKKLAPKDHVTRAEVAVLLKKMIEYLK
ncbi:S-layer homology domain-containing protein [Paenibacillus sp. KN14-4R]|uniref:S-layer homology domain-containing protein n=1 Tax=Paenibacillus sp. KN14-4R TaxID=3445773 RepID=UPI003FA0A8DC